MPNINPGPARTSHAPTVSVLTPVNNGPSPDAFPQGGNAFRLLARHNNLQLQVGDTCVPVINVTRFIPIMAVFTNSLVNGIDTLTQPANVAAARLGVYTTAGGPASGTPPTNQIIPSNTLAGVTNGRQWASLAASGTIFPFNAPQASGTLIVPLPQNDHGQNGPAVFVFCSTPIAGGTVDFFLYGFDMSDLPDLPARQIFDQLPPFAFSAPAPATNGTTTTDGTTTTTTTTTPTGT